MSLWNLALVLMCVFAIATGQLLFKLAAEFINQNPDQSIVARFVFNPYLIVALVVYMLATFGWVWALRYVALNQAYPLMSLAFVIVPVLSFFFLGERVDWVFALGTALMISGLVLITAR